MIESLKQPSKSCPTEYIKQLAEIYSNEIQVYVYLWENKDEKNNFHILKSEIPHITLFETKTFLSALRKICRHGLINIQEGKKFIKIDLVGWGKDNDE